MSSNRVLIIAKEFHTTMKNISHWLDYYQRDRMANFGSINETNFKPSLVYFLETLGSTQNRVSYHVVACPHDKVEKVFPDLYQDFELDSNSIKDYEKLLGVLTLVTHHQDKVFIKGSSEDDLNPEIWEHISKEIVFKFSPEDPNISMIDEKVTSGEYSDVMGHMKPGPTGALDIDDTTSQEETDKCKKYKNLKTNRTREKWKTVYEIIKRMRKEYKNDWDNEDTDNPEPTPAEIIDRMKKDLTFAYKPRMIREIKKAGDAGCMDT